MGDHIFDILGIGSSERSYTNLIASAFRHHPAFKNNLLKLFNVNPDGDWKVYLEPEVSITDESGKKKCIPDLILFSRDKNQAILIENKIFSGEGWNQTERYASKSFQITLKKKFECNNLDIKNYYLALDDTSSPLSKDFTLLPYSKLITAIPEASSNPNKIESLLTELKERINEYMNAEPPSDSELVSEYLKKEARLLNSYRLFQIMMKDVMKSHSDLSYWFGITANRGCGFIPFIQINKLSWSGSSYTDSRAKWNECFDLHLECQWNSKSNDLTYYIHYETKPYMTEDQLEKTPKEFQKLFTKYRDDIFQLIKKENIRGWKFSKRYLQFGSHSFPKITELKYCDLKSELINLTNTIAPVIDKVVRSSNQKG